MAREIEIKLWVTDLRAFRRALRRMGAASRSARRVHEWNELFDTSGSELKRRGELLRIRTELVRRSRGTKQNLGVERVTVTFKCPIIGEGISFGRRTGKYKVREEIEAEVADWRGLLNGLKALGMRVWFRYERYRTTFRLAKAQGWARDLLIELDETPIGLFAELEGPPTAIDRAARLLSYGERDYITEDYFVLFREHCRRTGKKRGDMLFKNNKR